MKRILIMADAKRKYFESAIKMLEAKGIVCVFGDSHKVGEEELAQLGKDANVVIAGSECWSKNVMKRCAKLKLIVRCGTGFDGVDLDAATELGIQVANTPGINTYAVAEMALTMILSLERRLCEYNSRIRQGGWGPLAVSELRGKTVGLLGFGGISKQLARLLQPFGCRILAYDVYWDREIAEQLHVEFTEMKQLLSESDVISLHLPLLKETKHIICRETFECMKHSALLVNTSRGGIVNSDDLCNALKMKKIAGAALDVYEEEPLQSDSPFFAIESLILTPHVASNTKEATVQMIEACAQEILQYYEKGCVEHLLNSEVL